MAGSGAAGTARRRRASASLPGQRPGALLPALQPQQANQGLGVGQFATHGELVQLGRRVGDEFEELALVQPLRALAQAAGKKDVDALVRIGDGVVQHAGIGPFGRGVAGLFKQLTLAASQRVLTGIELARRELQHHPRHRVAVLALHQQTAVIQQRHHHDRARMADVLAVGRAAVRQRNPVAAHVEEMAAVDLGAVERQLDEVIVSLGHGADTSRQSQGSPA
mmetsp:Transcript_15026/g.35425  ORF Transcript_15026/g.35425 Transcript_15026/m.35425 type:complete len:222 (-) Transcript_15026:5833-6498(-)